MTKPPAVTTTCDWTRAAVLGCARKDASDAGTRLSSARGRKPRCLRSRAFARVSSELAVAHSTCSISCSLGVRHYPCMGTMRECFLGKQCKAPGEALQAVGAGLAERDGLGSLGGVRNARVRLQPCPISRLGRNLWLSRKGRYPQQNRRLLG